MIYDFEYAIKDEKRKIRKKDMVDINNMKD